jgi:5-hydroxyisourate hydrolase-like protein (transthyretin family)
MPPIKTRTTARKATPIFVFALGTCLSFGQNATPPQTTPPEVSSTAAAPYRIAGRTVSTADGHPLQGATVLIVNTKTQQPVASTLSGEDGGFAFTDLKADKYSLQAVTTGYLLSAYDQHENFWTAIVTGAGLDTESLVLRMTPAAILGGRVTDEAGDPVRGATVTLYRENRDEGRSHITQFRNAQTDDLGEYEIVSLPPGTYFVSAKGIPWYASHPQLRNPANSVGLIGTVDPALDVAYPTMFFAGATRADGATPIPVRGGDQVDIDLHLLPLPAVTLTLHAAPGQQGARVPQLQESVFDQSEPVYGQIQSGDSDNSIVGVPPGHYVLSQLNQSTGRIAKSTMIDLTRGTVDVDATSGEDGGGIKIKLEDENGASLPPWMQVTLRSKEAGIVGSQPINDKGVVEFEGLKSGDYHLLLSGSDRLYHVTKIALAGKPSSNTVRVDPGTTVSVTVTFAAGSVAVEGFATKDGKPAAGVMIVLIPANVDDNIELFRRDQSDLDGSFLLPSVIPGKYTAVAIENGWELEWGRPEVLAHYLPKGVPVTIFSSKRGSVRLSDALIVQSR